MNSSLLPVAYEEISGKLPIKHHHKSASNLYRPGAGSRLAVSSLSYYESTPTPPPIGKKETTESSNPNMTFQSESGGSLDFVAEPKLNNIMKTQRSDELGDLRQELLQMKKQLSRVIEISI